MTRLEHRYLVISAGGNLSKATLGCVAWAILVRHGAKTSESPLLVADAENSAVNAAISGCVVVASGSIFLLQGTPYAGLMPYVDPGVVISVVAITIGVLLRMTGTALMELLKRAAPRDVSEEVPAVIRATTAPLPVEELFVRVIQPGRTRNVLSPIVLRASCPIESLAALDAIREETQARLRERHAATILDLVFTADRAWRAPIAIPAAEGT